MDPVAIRVGIENKIAGKKQAFDDFMRDVVPKYTFLHVRPGFNPLIEAILHKEWLLPEDRELLTRLMT